MTWMILEILEEEMTTTTEHQIRLSMSIQVDISGVPSPSRGSLASGVGDGPGSKYAVRDFSHSVDGVNMNNADDSERASVNSAPYRSEQSLEVRGAIGSSSIVAGVTGGSGSLGGKLNSLPASPFVRRASKSNSFRYLKK